MPARLTLTALALVLAGCGLTRPPTTASGRLALTQRRLDAAPTPDARRAVAEALAFETGLTPVAGLRRAFGPRPVVAGLVPGRRAGIRDTLVVVAAALDGPHAAALAEAARLVAARADTDGDAPERTVLVAWWSPGLSPAEGLTDVRAFPLWPPGAVRFVLTLDGPADPAANVVAVRTAPLDTETAVPDLATSILLAASAAVDVPR